MKIGSKAGAFRVDRRIGKGGAGEVFRAVHERTGLPVALKVLHRLEESYLELFRREAEDHAALAHPGVVYLFDYGTLGNQEERGQPFLAMELAACTLRDLMPLSSWSAVRNVLLQLLNALAYVHARGVVHRDLKPENVLVFQDPDGRLRLKLADFGLAGLSHLATEASRPERSDRGFSGTPAYMAPEQLREQWRRYGPATDLYALGCMAYEFICGKTPFSGSVVELGLKHLTLERPSLEPLFEVPDGVEPWIHGLMERDLQLRVGRACEAAARLPLAGDDGEESLKSQTLPKSDESGEDEISLGPTISLSEEVTRIFATRSLDRKAEQFEQAEQPEPDRGERAAGIALQEVPAWKAEDVKVPLPLIDTGIGLFALRGLPLVGRERERELLWEHLRSVVEERETRVVVLSGYAGVGKSRVAQWYTQRIHELVPAEVFVALHAAEEAPGEGIEGLFRRHFKTGELRRDEAYEHLRGVLAEEVARGVTEVLYPTDGLADESILGSRMVFQSSSARYRLIEEALMDTSGHRLPVLWVDDLQWAQGGRALLKYLLRREYQGPPVLIVTTLREDLRDESLERELGEFLEDRRVQEHRLDPLSASAQREFARRTLPVSERLLDLLVERTEGNPLFARQLLSEWIQSGALVAGEGGFDVAEGQEILLPDALQDLWISRVRRVLEAFDQPKPEDALQALMLGAVLGGDVVDEEWKAVTAAAECTVPADLFQRLVSTGLVRRTDQGFSFSHGLLAEALREEARQRGEWQRYHGLCGESLEKLLLSRGSSAGPAAPRLAHHWLAAGDLERALPALDRCVEFYRGRSDNQVLAQVYETRRDVMGRLGMDSCDRDWIANDLLLLKARRQEFSEEELQVRLDQMLSRAEQHGDGALISEVWNVRGEVHTGFGRLKRALDALEKAYQWAERSGDQEQRAAIGLRIGWARYRRGDLDEAEALFNESAPVLESVDRLSYLWTAVFLGWVKVAREERAEAAELFLRSRQTARDEGYRALEVNCLLGLADLRRYEGKFAEARVLGLEAARLHRLQGNAQSEMICWLNIATLEVECGNLERAEEMLEKVRGLFIPTRDRGVVPWIRSIELVVAASTKDEERCEELLKELWRRHEEGFTLEKDFLRMMALAAARSPDAAELHEAISEDAGE